MCDHEFSIDFYASEWFPYYTPFAETGFINIVDKYRSMLSRYVESRIHQLNADCAMDAKCEWMVRQNKSPCRSFIHWIPYMRSF